MYHWYQRAEVSFAYLSDYSPLAFLAEDFPHCRWLTRGWTLQELLGPRWLTFLKADWSCLGAKINLADHLSKITDIELAVLLHQQPRSTVSVARKVSRAAKKKTTRIEDTAYCLLGLVDVNMPLLYGEEDKAFRRLQEEIIRTIPVFSIFAWKFLDAPAHLLPRTKRCTCLLWRAC